MFKYFICVSFFVISGISLGQEINNDLHEKCIYPTIKIADDKELNGGTGFIVRSDFLNNRWQNVILTAAHVVDKLQNPCVYLTEYEGSEIKNCKKYFLAVYAKDEKRDIAVGYFISYKPMPTVSLRFESNLFIGNKILHVGHALLDDARIDYGEITQPKTQKPDNFKGLIRTNCYTYMGDSGCPLFLESDYSVIGICNSIRLFKGMNLSKMSYYRPIDDLKTWDKELNNALESSYKDDSSMPVIPFVKIKLREYEYQLPK